MRHLTLTLFILANAGILAIPAFPAEPDALAIEANIVANHLPFGGIIDPVYASPTSSTSQDIRGARIRPFGPARGSLRNRTTMRSINRLPR